MSGCSVPILHMLAAMTSGRTIGDAARELGAPASTLRYYERIGLVRPSARTASNYRLYTDDDMASLRFVRAAQSIGFSLDDVAELLTLRATRRALPRDVQRVLTRRIEALDAKISDLHRLQDELRSLLGRCRAGEGSGTCDVVVTLDRIARTGATKRPRNPA